MTAASAGSCVTAGVTSTIRRGVVSGEPLRFEIVDIRRPHLKGIRKIDKLVYDHPWSQVMYLDELSRLIDRIYKVAQLPQPVWAGLAGRSPSVLGYAGTMIVEDVGHVTSVAVHPNTQGRRLGARLMLEMHRAAVEGGRIASMSLEVRASNQQAQRLYRWFGYAPVGVRKQYYRRGAGQPKEDALIMWCQDIDTPEHLQRLDQIAADLGIQP